MLKVVEKLFDASINIDAADNNGTTALMFASAGKIESNVAQYRLKLIFEYYRGIEIGG